MGVRDTSPLKLYKKGITEDDILSDIRRLYGSEYLIRNDDRKINYMKREFMKHE